MTEAYMDADRIFISVEPCHWGMVELGRYSIDSSGLGCKSSALGSSGASPELPTIALPAKGSFVRYPYRRVIVDELA